MDFCEWLPPPQFLPGPPGNYVLPTRTPNFLHPSPFFLYRSSPFPPSYLSFLLLFFISFTYLSFFSLYSILHLLR